MKLVITILHQVIIHWPNLYLHTFFIISLKSWATNPTYWIHSLSQNIKQPVLPAPSTSISILYLKKYLSHIEVTQQSHVWHHENIFVTKNEGLTWLVVEEPFHNRCIWMAHQEIYLSYYMMYIVHSTNQPTWPKPLNCSNGVAKSCCKSRSYWMRCISLRQNQWDANTVLQKVCCKNLAPNRTNKMHKLTSRR